MASETKKKAELRRCNTELRREGGPSGDKEEPRDENQRLTKELAAYMAAKKSLERMFSRLGVEKEIMAGELEKKEEELREMEELLNDVKAQNETLRAKVKLCVAEHGKSSDVCRSDEKKESCRGREEEDGRLYEAVARMKRRVRQEQVVRGLSRIREFCRGRREGGSKEDIAKIEEMVLALQVRVALMGEERKTTLEEFIRVGPADSSGNR